MKRGVVRCPPRSRQSARASDGAPPPTRKRSSALFAMLRRLLLGGRLPAGCLAGQLRGAARQGAGRAASVGKVLGHSRDCQNPQLVCSTSVTRLPPQVCTSRRKVAQHSSKSYLQEPSVGPISTETRPCWPIAGETWPKLTKLCLILTNIGDLGRMSIKFGQSSPNIRRDPPNLVDIPERMAKVGRI